MVDANEVEVLAVLDPERLDTIEAQHDRPGAQGANEPHDERISPAAPSIGVAINAGVRRGSWSLAVEAAGNWSATATEGAAGAKSSLLLVSLAPCVHLGIAMGCAIGGVGSLRATGVVSSPQSDHAAFANAGVRLGAEIPFARLFYVQAHADGLANLTPLTFHLDGRDFWSTPTFSTSLGLALGLALAL